MARTTMFTPSPSEYIVADEQCHLQGCQPVSARCLDFICLMSVTFVSCSHFEVSLPTDMHRLTQ
eukprot:3974734-Amphidinium_carterae.1